MLFRYLLIAAVTVVASVASTMMIRVLARRFGVVAKPDGDRRLHDRIVPQLGGLGVVVGLLVGAAVAAAFGLLPGSHIVLKHLVGTAIAVALLAVGGALDDIYDLKPLQQIVWPILAIVAVVASGIGIDFVTNPFGGQLYLDQWKITVLWWDGLPYRISFVADAFTLLWLMTLTYTTKFLDGLDGLVSGVVVIGAVVIAAVSMMKEVHQPDTAALAVIVGAAYAGFLLFNRHPASIFLGEGGSTLAGFLLGTLAIVSGGKIATALLVLGLPLFDAILVILRRVFILHKSPFSGDRSHLHFRLQDWGLTPRQTVLVYYLVAAAFGTATLILDGRQKVTAIALLVCLVVSLIGFTYLRVRRARK